MSTPEISQLESQARQAYQQRRTRECVALIKSLRQLDPENLEAQTLQAAIQREIDRDLSDANALIEDSKERQDGSKYRKAAEIILLKIAYLDPDNQTARSMLAGLRTTDEQIATTSAAETPPDGSAQGGAKEDVPFTTGAVFETKKVERRGRRFTLPAILVGLVAIGAGAFLLQQSRATLAEGANDPATASDTFRPMPAAVPAPDPAPAPMDQALPPLTPVSSFVPQPSTATKAPASTATAGLTTKAAEATPDAGGNARPETSKPIAFVEAGTLSVTAPAPAEIYMGGKLLGSTPMSLQLIAGRHTLQYRLGDLRTEVTHEIKPNQTTNAVIAFDMTVQINARPWAQVYLEGTTRRPLGQTPLSNVRVPVGGVLVFENPNFATKSHRVSEGDTAIQVVFP